MLCNLKITGKKKGRNSLGNSAKVPLVAFNEELPASKSAIALSTSVSSVRSNPTVHKLKFNVVFLGDER